MYELQLAFVVDAIRWNAIMVGDWKALCCCSSVFECCVVFVVITGAQSSR